MKLNKQVDFALILSDLTWRLMYYIHTTVAL